jgi:hypothetical protein
MEPTLEPVGETLDFRRISVLSSADAWTYVRPAYRSKRRTRSQPRPESREYPMPRAEASDDGHRPPKSERSALSRPPIAPARARLISLLVLAVVGASAVDVAIDGDHWPFSSYPMYGRLREAVVKMKRLYGVTGEGEVELVVPRHLDPFHEARLMTAFKRLGRRPDASEAVPAAMRGCLERYAALRAAGAHDGPELLGLRLYELSWPLATGAANRAEPAVRNLLAEVWQ